MVRDAETHAEDDRRQRELVEARNTGESAAYQAERQLTELGDQVDSSSKEQIEAAIKDLRESLTSEDPQVIRSKTDTLQEAFHKVSEQMYAAAAQQQQQADNGTDGEGAATNGSAEGAGDETEVVDAEVVDGETR
jgi:molecular chaperone DnaK